MHQPATGHQAQEWYDRHQIVDIGGHVQQGASNIQRDALHQRQPYETYGLGSGLSL